MMTPGCRLLGFSASINDLLVAGIQGFQRDGDGDEYTSYCQSTSSALCPRRTMIRCPSSRSTLSYVMTTENRAFIERTSASDPDKTFSINWIAYTLQLMLGAEHYGMQVGEIFHGDRIATDDGIHTQSEMTNWWCYNLPPPARKSGMVAMKTCFPPLLFFPDVPAPGAHPGVQPRWDGLDENDGVKSRLL